MDVKKAAEFALLQQIALIVMQDGTWKVELITA